jgi:transketolase
MAEKLGLKVGRANLDEFAATLEELAKANPSIVAVTSDSRGSGKLAPFGKALPKQIVEVGIAEQNLVGITAGLAACGKEVFWRLARHAFLTARSLEQIKNDVCYSDVPAVLVGISSGVSYGALGTTHHSLHDLAVLRAINNLTIIVPADNFESREAIRYAAARGDRSRCSSASAKRRCMDLHKPETRVRGGQSDPACARATTCGVPGQRAKRWFTRCSPPAQLAETRFALRACCRCTRSSRWTRKPS